jgi:PAS domain S-box-containing protein
MIEVHSRLNYSQVNVIDKFAIFKNTLAVFCSLMVRRIMSRMLLKDFKEDRRLFQHGSTQKINILIILVCCFITLVLILAWFALDRVKEKIQADVGDALQIVLHTTRESLNLWVESNKSQLIRLAEDPRLVSLTEQHLLVPRDKISLFESKTLMEIRAFFRRHRDRERLTGFFVISPDFTNIISMRNSDIGSKNLIASQALDLLNRAFRGETVMVPPIWSDVPLNTSSEGKSAPSPTMFFAAPIKNKQGNVVAVVVQSVDPTRDFTRLIQLGRLGKSGETYAFGAYGKLLSESRFEEDLIKAGLLSEGQTSILSVSVRDPGGDMTKGFTPSVPRYQQPLTRMAEQATKGKSGLNVAGYRDYRGVWAYGVWLWDDNLGVGLATEIDQADALGPYFTTRMVILTVLGVTVLLALGSLVLAVLIDVRAKRSLQKSHDELELRVEERTVELKENQARLEQAEEQSRLLLETAQEGIFGVGEDGLVNFINPAGLALLGFEADEIIGQKIHPLIHHSRPDGTPYPIEECPMHHSLTQGVIGSRDDEVLWRKDGTSFHVEYTSVPIRKNGSVAGTVVVFRDISERKEAEEALRKSRATARGLLDATQESLLLLDKEGIIIAANRTAARRHQRKPEELIGKNRFDMLSENLRESRKAHFNDVLQTGKPADFEDVRDGMVFHHVYYPVQDKQGVIMGVAVFAQDITERKQAEEALRESEINMRTIFENSPLGMIHFDKDGTILDCNDMFVELMGSSRKKLIGFNTPKQTKDEELRAAIIKALAGETAEYEGNYTSVTGSKTTSLRIVFNPTEPGTSPTEVIATLEDITERKRAEEAIRESQERLSTILKTTNQGFWLVDNDTITLDVNNAMCEILGLGKEKIVGSNFFDFLDEKNRELFREQNRMRIKGIHSLYEISLIRADGQQVPCLMNASPLLDKDGNVVGSFGMTTNIAERKQMEEELRKNVDELERFSKVAYGREKKMIQLKQEINELMMQLGKAEKYKIVE